MGVKKSIAIMMTEISECHIVAYATVAMDKFILLYLLLLRRLKVSKFMTSTLLNLIRMIPHNTIKCRLTLLPILFYKNPEMNMLEILGQIHWSNIIR